MKKNRKEMVYDPPKTNMYSISLRERVLASSYTGEKFEDGEEYSTGWNWD